MQKGPVFFSTIMRNLGSPYAKKKFNLAIPATLEAEAEGSQVRGQPRQK
jgi:hypothetical protein